MTAAMELLSAALDSSGYIAVVGLKINAPPIQKFFAPADFAGAVAEAMSLDSQGYNAYYGTATFLSDSSRKAFNAQAVKAFKIDFDIAPDDVKKYPSDTAMFGALKQFCRDFNLSRPVIVNSGHGFHCYWIMSAAMDGNQGKIYAEKFKRICLIAGLKIDPTVTGDVARILRVPGTTNRKFVDDERQVELQTMVDMHDKDSFLANLDRVYEQVGNKEALGEVPQQSLIPGQALPAHLQNASLDEVTRSLLTGKPKKFSIIIRKSREGEGCAQLKDIYENQGGQDEPRWRAGLSVAWSCEDGQVAIHDMSNKYQGYDHDATVKKAELTAGPYTCSTFSSNWPQLCKDCKHKGHITSPIQLGEYVKKASAGTNVVLAMNKNVNDAPVAYTIPEYPFPYFRSDGGGVYQRDDGDEDGGKLVCDKDIYLVERLKDEYDGYILHMRMHHAMDGVIDFTMNAADFGSKDKLREHLNKNGILAVGKQVDMVRDYIKTWYSSLEQRKEVATVKTQFGWTEGHGSFVIGDREITQFGHKYSPAAPSLAPLTKMFGKKGDLIEWRKSFNVYAMDGMEAHAFCALVGFASPLLSFTPHKGVLINAFSQDSGTGKSTTLKAAMSIWGDPNGLMLTYRDTALSRIHRMGVYKNMPNCIDEITKLSEDDISDMLFSTTMGRGRIRMQSSSNSERINNTTWASMSLASSNRSFVESLQADKGGVEGELMRLLEPQIPDAKLLTKEQADAIFAGLEDNFGWAGEEFVRKVMDDKQRVMDMIASTQKRLDAEGNFVGKERFWSATFACHYVAGKLAQEVGLHDIDMERQWKYYLLLVRQMRSRIQYTSGVESKTDLLGEFCNLHSSNTLVVRTDKSKGTVTILQHNQGPLRIRFEENDNTVFVLMSDYRKYLRDKNVHLENYMEEQRRKGKFLGEAQKRLAAGTDMPSPPSRVYMFKTDGDESNIP